MNDGWIALCRLISDGKISPKGINYCGAMMWLIAKAHGDDDSCEGNNIKRGQLFVGLSYLSKEWKLSTGKTRNILRHLQKDGFLTSESTNKGRILTICNYDSYQNGESTSDKLVDDQTAKPTMVEVEGDGNFHGNYPTTVEEVLTKAEIAGKLMTPIQAESYLLSRQRIGWIYRGSLIRNIGSDIARYLLTWHQNEADKTKGEKYVGNRKSGRYVPKN